MAASIDLSDVFGLHHGRVTSFDDHVGAGVVTTASGAGWPFHCTSIAGGSRTIEVGAQVTFQGATGPMGFEAVDVASTATA